MSLKGKLSVNNTLSANTSIPDVIRTSGASSWNEISGKPFNTVDTEGGLTIQDHTLMIDTLDTISTIDYVNQQIDGVTTTLEDYALKSEIPTVPTDVSAFNNDAGYIDSTALTPYVTSTDLSTALTPYVEASDLASVATSGDYDDLLNKPTIPVVPTDVSAFTNDSGYITDTALTPYVEASSLTTVAYSGDYSDLINKPTIPQPTEVTVTQTLSSGTEIGKIDVDGTTTVLYAPAGGGSSTQSDWNQNNSSARDYIKNRTHYVTRTSVSESWDNNEDPIYNGIYPDGEWDNYRKVEWRINDSNTRQDILDFLDAVPVDADFSVSVSYNYTYEWEGSTERNSDSRTITFHKNSEGEYGFSDVEDDTLIEIGDEDWDGYYKICIELWDIPEEHDNDPTLDTTLNSVLFACNTTVVEYTKLDSNYLDIDGDTIKMNGSGKLYTDNSMNAKMGIKISNRDISVNSDLNAFGPVDMGGIRREEWLSSLTTPIGTYIGGGIIKTDSNANVSNIRYTTWPSLLFDSSSTRREKWRCTNFTGDQNLRRVHTQVRYYKWYDSKWFGPYYISGMFIGQRINGKYEIKVEGWESILDSIVPIDNGWGGYSGYTFTFKEDITLSPTDSEVAFPFIWCSGLDNIPDPQKINSYFLPIDNKSIKRDSDGNIYAGYIVANADGSLRATQPSTTYNTSDGTFIVGTDNTHSGTLSSLVSGYHNQATGARGIIVGGQYNIASNECELVTGQYNYDTHILNRSIARITGNGISTSNRSNAEMLDSQGNLFLAGNVYTNVSDWSDPIGHSFMIRNIPNPPTTDGTYTLQVTVSNGSATYSWV